MFNKLKSFIVSKLKDEKGQGMVEYALLIGLVAIVVIAVLIFLGPAISDIFKEIIEKLGGEVPVESVLIMPRP